MFQYPDSIKPYVYNGFDKMCEHDLNKKGVGAFAFFGVAQPWNITERNQRAFDRKMNRNPFRDRYTANKVLDRAHLVGFAMVVNGGIIHFLTFSCQKIRRTAKTKDELVNKLIQDGLPIDPAKFCDVAEMYRAPAYLTEAVGA
jgi:hypothetical protein